MPWFLYNMYRYFCAECSLIMAEYVIWQISISTTASLHLIIQSVELWRNAQCSSQRHSLSWSFDNGGVEQCLTHGSKISHMCSTQIWLLWRPLHMIYSILMLLANMDIVILEEATPISIEMYHRRIKVINQKNFVLTMTSKWPHCITAKSHQFFLKFVNGV